MSKVAEILLNALIAETQNDPVDFMNVTSETLNISDEDFITALRELEFLGYVKNVLWGEENTCLYDDIIIITENFKLS